MRKKLKKKRNIHLLLGFSLILLSLSRLSIEGLGTLTIFTGILGIVAFLTNY